MVTVKDLYFFLLVLKQVKCSGSCNNINDPYTKLRIPDVVKNINVRVFNLMPRTNQTRHKEWHDPCKCKCRLDATVCNNKQWRNEDKCRCECKILIGTGICDEGFIWNPSNCECECDKSCNVGEYLDCENCKCGKKLVDKLVEECTENVEEVKLAKITSAEDENKHKNKCNFWTLFIVLFSIILVIGTYFVYYKYMKRDEKTATKYDSIYQTTI